LWTSFSSKAGNHATAQAIAAKKDAPVSYFVAGGGVAASQQFGGNQTDLFSVDNSGRLNVSWVDNAGPWQGPLPIGPSGLAPGGAFVAASRQFGLTQTDAFLVDQSGQLNVFWVDGFGVWNGPEKIGPAGIANPGCPLTVSQQFGGNQIDVFLIDKNGQLNVFWVDNAGAWNGPEKIGPAGLVKPGSFVAASQQFGLIQTDVFLVDEAGQLNVFWVDGFGAWNGPEKIGPAGLANPGCALAASQQFGGNQTDVFLIDKNGQLNVFWVDNAGAWNGPEKIGPAGIAQPGSLVAASQQFGLTQTDVFLVDKNGQLNVFWVDGFGAWNGPEKIGPAGIANPGCALAASQQFGLPQTDVFLVDKNGRLNIFWVDNAGAWNGPLLRADPVAPPAAGLGSNSNYILFNNCNPVLGLTVTINVTQDIVCQSASGPTTGFGFQLNAYSPKNETSAWQQYVVALFSSELIGAVDNWPISGPNIINDFFNLTGTPSTNRLPAGWQIRISLQNDSQGNITGATYVVIDSQGNTKANATKTLTSISGVTAADIAPITAFELNLVGPVNGESAVLSSGAGTIVYSASSPLTVLNVEPSCTESGYITAETANSFYGELSGSPSTVFTQSFEVGTEMPMIRKVGKVRPGLIIPSA
jgi:hypothetical protein